jgi:hypothetical protein
MWCFTFNLLDVHLILICLDQFYPFYNLILILKFRKIILAPLSGVSSTRPKQSTSYSSNRNFYCSGLQTTTNNGPMNKSNTQANINSRLPQPGGPGPHIYIPREQGGPVIPPGTGFFFRRLLRLPGPRWRYSKPPPYEGVLTHESSSGRTEYRSPPPTVPLLFCAYPLLRKRA